MQQRPDPRRLLVSQVVDSLDPVMERRGFERRNPDLVEATTADRCVASWLRDPPEERFRDAQWPDGTREVVGWADGVNVWSDGYVIFVVAEMFARVEWRSSPLDPDEFAFVIGGMVDQVDRFAKHTGPPLHPGGWTRG